MSDDRFEELMDADVTAASVEEMLTLIRAEAHDDESAHIFEDRMRARVLGAVAVGHPDSVRLAELALQSHDIKFSRWCA